MSDFIIENGTLIKYKGPDWDIIVPAAVTKIGANVFDDTDHPMTSVILPVSVDVDGDAFWGEEDLTVFYDKHSVSWLAEYYLEMQDTGHFDDQRVDFDFLCEARLRTDNGERNVYAFAFPLWLNRSNLEGQDILPEYLKAQEYHLLTFPEMVTWVDTKELTKGNFDSSIRIVVKNRALLKELLHKEPKLRESLLAGCIHQIVTTPEMLDDSVLMSEFVWKLLLDYAHQHNLKKVESMLMEKNPTTCDNKNI